jgi:hypothetical protein
MKSCFLVREGSVTVPSQGLPDPSWRFMFLDRVRYRTLKSSWRPASQIIRGDGDNATIYKHQCTFSESATLRLIGLLTFNAKVPQMTKVSQKSPDVTVPGGHCAVGLQVT